MSHSLFWARETGQKMAKWAWGGAGGVPRSVILRFFALFGKISREIGILSALSPFDIIIKIMAPQVIDFHLFAWSPKANNPSECLAQSIIFLAPFLSDKSTTFLFQCAHWVAATLLLTESRTSLGVGGWPGGFFLWRPISLRAGAIGHKLMSPPDAPSLATSNVGFLIMTASSGWKRRMKLSSV